MESTLLLRDQTDAQIFARALRENGMNATSSEGGAVVADLPVNELTRLYRKWRKGKLTWN
jgi:hypothetical protein